MWLAVKLDLLPIGVGARSGGVRMLEEWSLTTDFRDEKRAGENQKQEAEPISKPCRKRGDEAQIKAGLRRKESVP